MKVFKIGDTVVEIIGHLTLVGVNAYIIYLMFSYAYKFYQTGYTFGLISTISCGVLWSGFYIWYIQNTIRKVIIPCMRNRILKKQ